MNITNNEAGMVSQEHILSKGFTIYETLEVNDMGQCMYELPQFTNGKITIEGGYWTYLIKDKNGKILFEGWWNSNDEFDKTILEINANNQA